MTSIDRRLKLVKQVSAGVIFFEDGSEYVPHVNHLTIGTDVWLSPELQIGLPERRVEEVVIGDHTRIFKGIIAPEIFHCGDYVTIHEGVWCYGRGVARIGHNSWFGMRCTLDAEGGFSVGNGFGAGQDTHLWSHIRHGDVSMGSKYLSFSFFRAANDVWFVGRCTSGPTGDNEHGAFSVALTESNVTKPMESNHVYGGNPAKDLTEKIGTPYEFTVPEARHMFFSAKVEAFMRRNPDLDANEILKITANFNPVTRLYFKTNDPVEVKLMKFLLPEMKFAPAVGFQVYPR